MNTPYTEIPFSSVLWKKYWKLFISTSKIECNLVCPRWILEYTGIFHIPFFWGQVCPGYFCRIFQTNYHTPDFHNLCMSWIKFGMYWDIQWKMEYSRIWLICMSQILKWNIPQSSKKVCPRGAWGWSRDNNWSWDFSQFGNIP